MLLGLLSIRPLWWHILVGHCLSIEMDLTNVMTILSQLCRSWVDQDCEGCDSICDSINLSNDFEGGSGGDFSFFPLSNVFSLYSHQVSSEFPKDSQFQHFPQDVPNSTSLLSHMLWQMLSSWHLYIGEASENSPLLQNRTFYFEEIP